MSVFDEQLKGLSPEEQSILVEVSQALYSAAEAQLLEGLRHTQDRPRDGFDALVMVCSVARAIQSLTIGSVMGDGLISVSTDFPFSAAEMVAATSQHINAATDALFNAVDEAIERLGPVLIELTFYFASTHPEERTAFARLVVGDVGPIH